MLKTQITGAKYLSPQTNQMTNLNIAVPADSKDTEFGTSDILLAKDIVTYLNALDSDISNELDAQTDKINKINESIKQLIDHNLIKIVTELPTTDIDKNCIYLVPNKDGEGNNVFIEYIYVESKNTFEEVGRIQAKVDLSDYYTKEQTDSQIETAKNSAINIHNEDNTKSITLDINDTEAAGENNSTVNASLRDEDGYSVNINAKDGFTHTTDEGFTCNLDGYGLFVNNGNYSTQINSDQTTLYVNDNNAIALDILDERSRIVLGSDDKFKISRPIDNTEGATITGVKSMTAFADSSATKVWATDGSIVDLSTKADASALDAKANTSDVLLKKSASGGYYIEKNSNTLGFGAFAANSQCTASGSSSFAEGCITKALGYSAHAEGYDTTANGSCTHAEGKSTQATQPYAHAEGYHTQAILMSAHAEGNYTVSNGYGSHSEGNSTKAGGYYSHAEGNGTEVVGFAEHAQGTYNVINKNAIHSVGIGNDTTRKNAEYIYAKNTKNGSNLVDDPKNGYKYLIGIGGYDGISTDSTTYKSVQEVIADLTARIEQLETKVRALEAANTPA